MQAFNLDQTCELKYTSFPSAMNKNDPGTGKARLSRVGPSPQAAYDTISVQGGAALVGSGAEEALGSRRSLRSELDLG